ncbi:hypothetical protein M495_24680 [Serratia liquefaciens ATCC 27592]|nr:hypothetical protein M495_24680 [Serratia liquefaciens ATCC 27592]
MNISKYNLLGFIAVKTAKKTCDQHQNPDFLLYTRHT